jgi:hypothetical protein
VLQSIVIGESRSESVLTAAHCRLAAANCFSCAVMYHLTPDAHCIGVLRGTGGDSGTEKQLLWRFATHVGMLNSYTACCIATLNICGSSDIVMRLSELVLCADALILAVPCFMACMIAISSISAAVDEHTCCDDSTASVTYSRLSNSNKRCCNALSLRTVHMQ